MKIVESTPEKLVEVVAERLIEKAAESIRARDRFLWALAGGSTPKALYELLATPAFAERIEWEKVFIVFGDERAVSPDDENSNYRMVSESLFSKIDIPPQNVFRMEGEVEDLHSAARQYSERIEALNAPLDVALLGMGDDGHTASLFPHSAALNETSQFCVATDVAPLDPHVRRLTLTYPVFNAAREVWILVTGEKKAERLIEALNGPRDFDKLPVQGIAPDEGELFWMLDKAAQSKI